MQTLRKFRLQEVVLVSPHPDDIAFSCGATAKKLAMNFETTVITVFTKSNWCPLSEHESGEIDSDYVSRIRTREDAEFAATIGASLVSLGQSDAGLRGYDDDTELGPIANDDLATEQVATALKMAISGEKRRLFLAPQGVGGHVDHLITRDATLAVAPHSPILLYEDLPYAVDTHSHAHSSATQAERTVSNESMAVWFDAPDLSEKLQLAAIYYSQFREKDRQALEVASRRASHNGSWAERFALLV